LDNSSSGGERDGKPCSARRHAAKFYALVKIGFSCPEKAFVQPTCLDRKNRRNDF